MNTTLASLYDGNKKIHNNLLELNTTQYHRYKEFSVHLSNITLEVGSKHIYYHTVRYGKYISTTKQHVKISGNKKSRSFNMEKSKKNMLFITANKEECLSLFPNTYIHGTVLTKQDLDNPSMTMSGVVILMMAVLRDTKNETYWNDDIHEMALRCKPNSLSSYSHHDTTGFVYSFGNRPNYGNNEGSSVSIYVNKKSKVEAKNNLIHQEARYLEYLSAQSLDHGIQKIAKIFPDIKLLISPIINAAFDRQYDNGVELLQPCDASENGCWNSFYLSMAVLKIFTQKMIVLIHI